MLVTCYYDIYNNPEKYNMYMELFDILAKSGLPIILFVDSSFVTSYESVNVIRVPLEELELYSIASNGKELPLIRNIEKDTKEYLALMNSKIEFIKRAAELVQDDTFVWVDFGIFKLIQNPSDFINKLKYINENTYTNITIPGCWDSGLPYSHDSVNWRFCGTLFIIPRRHIDSFYNHSKNILVGLSTLTWEVNVWNIVEKSIPNDITWYLADHNDSLLNL
jgi:hypothetical protein